jgi:phospholipid/cholesterol/gamma-HCH transport system substrate-binding protein
MERNANYALVGLFVIIFVSAVVGFIFWFGKYGSKETEFDRYKCYFTESVSGLNKESPVKFKGVKIGTVSSLNIDANNAERIEVMLKVAKGSPIKADSLITLGSQGLTGLSYLEIKDGSKDGRLLKEADQQEVPEIKSQLSLVTKLTQKAEGVGEDMSKLLAKIDKIMSEKNLKNVESSLDNLQKISSELKNSRQEIRKLITNGAELEKKGDAAIEKLSGTIDKATLVIQNSNEMMDEIKLLTIDGQSLVNGLKESPSDILFKQKPIKLGPGESK